MENIRENNKDLHIMTDDDVKRKALKSVLLHIRKKMPPDHELIGYFNEWAAEMEELLERPEFEKAAFYDMRHKLNNIIEKTYDGDIRFKLRDSWYSLGKALDKKLKPK